MARILPDVLSDGDFPVVFGRYTLLGLLGEGGMARVFRAELQGHEGFRKPAAIKIVRSSIASDNDRLRTSLINEARLGGLLHHPNVVDTYDFGEVDGLPFIAMEYIRGIGLEKVLHLVDPLPPAIAAEIGAQICAGLDHAHNLEDVEGASELVHRDLKPSNVILSRDGLVKVMDFGIAKAEALSATNTATGMTKGTPSYMSPEQVNGDGLDRRSDIFALGAIIYELFTGERLFTADSLMSILMAVIQVEERLVKSGALDRLDMIALGLADIVSGCLRRNPDDRFPDAAAVEHALKLLSRQLPPPPSMKTWARGLMADQGMGVGEDSISTVPPMRSAPLTLKTGPRAAGAPPPTRATDRGFAAPGVPTSPQTGPPPTIATSPTMEPAPTIAAARPTPTAAPTASQVPPTRLQPVPQPPPPTPDQTPTRVQDGGTLWVDGEGGRRRRKKKKKKGAPLLILLLGLLLGGTIAIAAVVGVLLMVREPAPVPVASAEPEPTGLVDMAVASDPKPTAAPTPKQRRPRTEGVAPAASPAPTPEVTAEAAPELTPEPTPDATAATAEPTPDATAATAEPTPAAETPRPTPRHRTAEPTPAPQPTPVAGDSERTEKERLSDERRRALLGDRATTRPKEEAYAGPPTLGRPKVQEIERTEDGIKVRFQVLVQGDCPDPDLMLRYNPPKESWLEAPLKQKSNGWAMVNVTLAPRNQGKVVYEIEGSCAGGAVLDTGRHDRVIE